MNPFDYVNAINLSKKDLIRSSENTELAEKSYVPFVVNKALSYFVDTIMYANEMNINSHIDAKLQNDYYLNSVRVSKRFSKWSKKIEDGDVESIQEYYKVSFAKAVEICKVLTSEQINLIKEKIIKGGNHVQSKSTGGSKTSKP
jgi:hypothetical protein